ncbi:GmrSD restriction endonuclease domain-containing protein [Viridibacillus arvi]|uniref:GmrSD restriction endonuclease domain-containing protein n=1 Tax=Viridibacillus arvi TaxID=263475 RepID=UPI003CFCCD14
MRISPKIEAAAGFNPTKKTHQMDIATMCEKIKNNKMTLPLYQRDISWNLQKAVDLFNFQLFGKAPVSPISINEINEVTDSDVPQISFLTRDLIEWSEIKGDHQSVVDGQQRLTTNFKAYINDESFRNIVLDFARGTFRIVEGVIASNQIPVGILLNKEESILISYLQEKGNFNGLFAIALRVRTKIRSYNYTINIAENLTEDEQIQWFEVLNNAGSRVTALQMSFSKLKMHDLDIYADYTEPFKEKAHDFGFGELFTPFTTNVSYPIAALNPAYEVVERGGMHNTNYAPIPSDTKESILTKLSVTKLEEIIQVTLDSLENALGFIVDNGLKEITNRMDYILYLSGFFAFQGSAPLTSEVENKLINWVETVDFINQSNSARRQLFVGLLKLRQ